MATVLGLRGTGSFSADERPQNWREVILYQFPNGGAPLTALLSKLRSESTDDYQFNWWEQINPTQMLKVNGGQLIGDTTIEVKSNLAQVLRRGCIVWNVTQNERVYVTTDPTLTTEFDCIRDWDSGGGAAWVDDDDLIVLGSAYEDGDGAPSAQSLTPTKKYNLTETFRNACNLTRRAKKMRVRTNPGGPSPVQKRDALSFHAQEQEKQFLFGTRVETTGPTGEALTATGGLTYFIDAGNQVTFNGAAGFTIDDWMDNVEIMFRYGSNGKLMLAGSYVIRELNRMALRTAHVNLVPTDEVYGMQMMKWLSPFGTLFIKQHPLMSQVSIWRDEFFVLDLNELIFRYITDTTYRENIQDPDQDQIKDEYLTDAGLEIHHPTNHFYGYDMTTWIP